jgi:hypothetical protein
VLDDSLIEPKLRKVIQDAWEDPSKEDAILELLEGSSVNFLTWIKSRIFMHFDKAAKSQNPYVSTIWICLESKSFHA